MHFMHIHDYVVAMYMFMEFFLSLAPDFPQGPQGLPTHSPYFFFDLNEFIKSLCFYGLQAAPKFCCVWDRPPVSMSIVARLSWAPDRISIDILCANTDL